MRERLKRRLARWAGHPRAGDRAATIRLEGARSKSGQPRVFPFRLAPPLKALLAKRWAERDGLYVFHIDGRPIGVQALRYAWKRATKRAGVPGRLIHDLRRTCARDMRRTGLAESDIMELCGWETRAMFKRYAIKDDAANAEKLAKAAGLLRPISDVRGGLGGDAAASAGSAG